ncbi:hypothetical protein [Muricoccus radiodurans]|uniref:hypothetical protein n=1 Tax=Muricoccus radiodurans TaxID=2231721 RepID=UPI003CEF773C
MIPDDTTQPLAEQSITALHPFKKALSGGEQVGEAKLDEVNDHLPLTRDASLLLACVTQRIRAYWVERSHGHLACRDRVEVSRRDHGRRIAFASSLLSTTWDCFIASNSR